MTNLFFNFSLSNFLLFYTFSTLIVFVTEYSSDSKYVLQLVWKILISDLDMSKVKLALLRMKAHLNVTVYCWRMK